MAELISFYMVYESLVKKSLQAGYHVTESLKGSFYE